MRIALVITSLGTGGAENLVVNLSLKLSELGHSVRVVTLSDAAGLPRELAAKAGVDVVSLGTSARDPRAVARLPKAVQGFDIVHVHLFPAFYFGALAPLKQPKIFTEHSTFNKRRPGTLYLPAERFAYGRYDQLIAISDGVADSLRRHLSRLDLRKTISVIHNGISDTFFEGAPDIRKRNADPIRLITIGTLDSRKNISDAVSATHALKSATLTIVGSGPLEASLRRQVESLGLKGRVRLIGQRGDIRELLDEHDALLSTSRYEGFGLVAAEAMARGLPVIGPDVPGLREVVSHENTGLLFRPNLTGVDAIAQSIERLDDDTLYKKLSGNALAESVRFTTDRAARAHLDLYTQEIGNV